MCVSRMFSWRKYFILTRTSELTLLCVRPFLHEQIHYRTRFFGPQENENTSCVRAVFLSDENWLENLLRFSREVEVEVFFTLHHQFTHRFTRRISLINLVIDKKEQHNTAIASLLPAMMGLSVRARLGPCCELINIIHGDRSSLNLFSINQQAARIH